MIDSPLLIDYRKGSINLALYEPIRSLLSSCLDCSGEINRKTWVPIRDEYSHSSSTPLCASCGDTGRVLSTLSSADISFIGNGPDGPIIFGIEIKELTELLSSLISGRLQDTQMRGMIEDYDPGCRWVLHYGRYRPSPVDGMIQIWKEGSPKRRAGWYTFRAGNRTIPYGYLEAFKCCSAREAGFSFDKVETITEAAHWLGVFYRTWTRPYHTHKSMKVFDKSQDVRARMRNEAIEKNVASGMFYQSTMDDKKQKQKLSTSGVTGGASLIDRAAVFSQFPNIGYERAKAAAERFSTIRQGVNASIDDWSDIEVILNGRVQRSVKLGKEVAKQVVKFVSE